VVDGVLEALRTDPTLHVVLVGPERVAEDGLAACPEPLRTRVSVAPAGQVVGMEERPVWAVRAKAGATVRVAMETLRDAAAEAVVTAGSTGAAVAAAHVVLGSLPGVHRPALAAVIPAAAGPVVLLDVGATPDPTAEVLVQHASLGVAYARVVLAVGAPRLGLLSTGAEQGRGDALRRRLDERLAALADASRGAFTYGGLVEGQHVPLGGVADVVLTDGFTGNVLLKGMEGVVTLVREATTEAAGAGAPAVPAGPRAAMLLGVPGTVVVGHGAGRAADVAACVARAAAAVRDGEHQRFGEEFRALTRAPGDPTPTRGRPDIREVR
jgi:glycerol-3-phosphate acyltransferase PlsX